MLRWPSSLGMLNGPSPHLSSPIGRASVHSSVKTSTPTFLFPFHCTAWKIHSTVIYKTYTCTHTQIRRYCNLVNKHSVRDMNSGVGIPYGREKNNNNQEQDCRLCLIHFHTKSGFMHLTLTLTRNRKIESRQVLGVIEYYHNLESPFDFKKDEKKDKNQRFDICHHVTLTLTYNRNFFRVLRIL